jgi:peroxin-5
MAMRDLVMGGGACAVPDPSGASSSANPLGGFADSLMGTAKKTQVR